MQSALALPPCQFAPALSRRRSANPSTQHRQFLIPTGRRLDAGKRSRTMGDGQRGKVEFGFNALPARIIAFLRAATVYTADTTLNCEWLRCSFAFAVTGGFSARERDLCDPQKAKKMVVRRPPFLNLPKQILLVAVSVVVAVSNDDDTSDNGCSCQNGDDDAAASCLVALCSRCANANRLCNRKARCRRSRCGNGRSNCHRSCCCSDQILAKTHDEIPLLTRRSAQ